MSDRLFDELLLIRRNREHANAQFDREEAQVIALLRVKGYSWEDIGRALGVTRQSAWERYGKGVEEPHRPTS